MNERPSRGDVTAIALLAIAVGTFLLRGAFVDFDHLGAKDWNAFLGQTEAEVASIEREGSFPWWNPWRRGGQVGFAQPESMFLSPVTPLALAFGTLTAFKLLLVPIFAFGWVGMWLLAKALGLRGSAAVAPAAMFFTSAAFPYYVAGGLPNWLFGIAILPWLLWCRRRAEGHHGFLLLGAILVCAVIGCGSVYQFVFFPLIVGLDGLLESTAKRRIRPVLTAGAMLFLGAAISLVRVLPMFEVYRVYPRELDATERYLTLEMIGKAFLDPRHPDLLSLSGTVFLDGENWISWVTVGCFVGPAFVLLATIGFAARWRAAWSLLVLSILLGWMSLGSGAVPSLWNLVHSAPLLRSMQAPERLLVPAAMILSLGAGFAIDALVAWISRFPRLASLADRLSGVIVLCAALLPLRINAEIPFAAFPEEPRVRDDEVPGPFQQAIHAKRPTQWGGELYEAVK